ncbi:hypothetical protein [Persephonella hydrogeniphila]|uniref:hypothetical protein n=1 Tax=Persephonella hydrogeniphila TaxID=198703 RepID=UPI0015DF66B2|nr:hypothetical protein [Persephonella hydrogeniphila]
MKIKMIKERFPKMFRSNFFLNSSDNPNKRTKAKHHEIIIANLPISKTTFKPHTPTSIQKPYSKPFQLFRTGWTKEILGGLSR